MAKIVLSMDGVVLQEMVLSKERITIGRRPHNDLVIDNSAVSAEHAVIVTMLRDAYLEDLNSTNGTRMNGQPVKKHFLKNNDVIELAKYKIRFVRDDDAQDDGALFPNALRKTLDIQVSNLSDGTVPKRAHRDGNTVVLATPAVHIKAVLKILSGPNTGKEIPLNKPLTTIGLPGKQVAVVTHRDQSYSLTHVEGGTYPIINGKEIGASAYTLTSGDRIELSDTQMAFSLI
jgi:pSer/pThr/pTyr-binding forkhead associated (FHA) protein